MNIFILSYDYSDGYEISLVWIVYTANSRILRDKENTVRYWVSDIQNLVNVYGLRYSKPLTY